MSKKIFGIIFTVVGIGLTLIPGIGQALGLPLIAGTNIGVASVIGLAVSVAGSVLIGPNVPKGLATTNRDRLSATLVPTAPRKIAFGLGALGNDVRYK